MLSKEYKKSVWAVKPIAGHIRYLRNKDPNVEVSVFVSNIAELEHYNDVIRYRENKLTNSEKDELYEKYTREVLDHWQKKFAGARKWSKMDENNECHELTSRTVTKSSTVGGKSVRKTEAIPYLPVREITHRLSEIELQRIRDTAFNNYKNLSEQDKVKMNVFDEEEYARWMILDVLVLIGKESEKGFHNECKAEQLKKTKKHKIKTKLSDVELVMNIHIKPDWKSGAHIHVIAPPFDPTTGLFSSPKNYVDIYRKVSIKLEKKYSYKSKSKRLYKFMEEGVAIGAVKQISNDLKEEAVLDIMNKPTLLNVDKICKDFIKNNGYDCDIDDQMQVDKFFTELNKNEEAKAAFDEMLKSEAEAVYESRKEEVSRIVGKALKDNIVDYDKLHEELKANGVEIDFGFDYEKDTNCHFDKKKDVEHIFEFTDLKTGIKFNNASFKGDARSKVKRFASSYNERNQLQNEVNKTFKTKAERLPYDVDNIQVVLAHNMRMTKAAMHHELSLAPYSKEEVIKIKRKHFETYMQMCLESGILVNLNKQGNLTYHKINKNRKKNNGENTEWFESGKAQADYSAFKYKSSWFSEDLRGKDIKELFELDDETIIRLNLTWVMDAFPARFMQYKVAFMSNKTNLLEQMNQNADAKSFLLLSIQKNYDYRKLEQRSTYDGGYYIYSIRNEQPTVYFKPSDDSSFDVLFQPFQARSAALDTWAHTQKEVLENLDNADYGTSFYAKDGKVCDFLRTMYVERAFCPNQDMRNRIEVRNGFDERTVEFMQKKFDTMLEKAEASIDKAINTPNKNSFNFTNLHGAFVLSNEEFDGVLRDRYEEFLNRSIVKLEQAGFTDLTMNGIILEDYVRKNEQRIEHLRESKTSTFNLNNKPQL
ncbi:hypothetical protein BBL97_04440 [Vibrio parahaemolyticus]|uniref:hypothetical protein n=1 Tax=Vibrio parahaemolyticus TaxID=670 RepID=UPI00084A7C78|nr:hypothetical protein [Vibrio parahaemolyticus]ODW92418.1 hypothetical protein BBL95_13025 [Vibrio parahaemolyticus]ODX07149.1 hypothetical protein BBL96_10510 [Vibrio parahaemolyticus]ODX10738.1 hypothetical protein BBL97_04440 [Vibrio parahaemolyticus]ODX14016.1 hypothetical protein BBL98_00520 [Vibrio parahaemolyticus]ODX18066.1 hypothetical protein BBL99_11805 [Vibrio parahaemolyticus]